MKITRWVIEAIKSVLGVCPTPGCWGDSTTTLGYCIQCWNDRSRKKSGGPSVSRPDNPPDAMTPALKN